MTETINDENSVVVECELDAAPEKVWRALTVPEFAEQWLGAEHRGGGGDTGGVAFEILDTEPFTRVRYGWRDDAVDEPRTVVTVDLAPARDGRTRFRLVHSIAAATPVAANSNRPPPLLRAA